MPDLDAIKAAQKQAREAHKREHAGPNDGPTTQEIVDDAHETAALNHEADQENQPEDEEASLENDTSKTAKQNTAKSQLDPTGDDPISNAEINRSATDADMSDGNKTAVSNEEAAERAKNPGEAEENAPLSLANDNEPSAVPNSVAHPNRHQR